MADIRISNIPQEATSTSATDLAVITIDPTGLCVTKKVQLQNLLPHRTRTVFMPPTPSSTIAFIGGAMGLFFPDGEYTTYYCFGTVPEDYAGDGQIEGVVVEGSETYTGTAGYFYTQVRLGADGEEVNTHYTSGYSTINCSSETNQKIHTLVSLSIPDASAGDFIAVGVTRHGISSADTSTGVFYCRGALLTYTADG